MKQVDIIIEILKNNGGIAHLSKIYSDYQNYITSDISYGIKAGIRKCIEVHSSDSDNFKGNDIFYSVRGKGYGEWGLLSHKDIY